MTRNDHKAAIAVCTGVTLLAAVLAFWWSTTERYQLTGDEPHYFILAASLLRDGDVDVRNNFDEDAATGEIYGPIGGRHVQTYNGREYSNHTPGLSVLLILPFAIGGTVAGRLLLCFLITPILGWACLRWLEGRAPPRDVALVIAGVLLCPVILLGSGQVYGDLLGGVVIVALVVWLWNPVGRDDGDTPRRRSPVAWMLFGLVAGFLPWVHMKYLAVTALLGLFAAWQIWAERQSRHVSTRSPWWGYASAGAFLLIGPATLLAYQMATHGRPLGGLGGQVSRTPYLHGLEFLIGNHLDQAQGLFWHQPLLLFGLIALGWMIRVRHRFTVPWLLLYGSLMVPPALLVEWAGIPLGRLNWPGMWLWLLPIGWWMAAERTSLSRYIRPVLLAAFAYQAMLALRWIASPTELFQGPFSSLVWERDSLFPLPVRYALPHFYLRAGDGWWVARYLEYLPNLIWVAAAGLLFVTGWMWSENGRRRLRPVWASGLVVSALLLPVEPTADRTGPHDGALHEQLTHSIASTFPRRFEAERMTPMQTAPQSTRADPNASDGYARDTTAALEREDQFVVFGPYLNLHAGRYRVEATLRLGEPSELDVAGRFDVVASRGRLVLASVPVATDRLPTDGSYTRVTLSFDATERLDDVEFRIAATPGADLLVDCIDLIPVLP
ncbi:MAG: hypothetical protein F4W89_07310 [Acidobacteria bacterium]|nr:hypothetical protein [Acidobacteriota bacterium]